jgi:hypothetical protein
VLLSARGKVKGGNGTGGGEGNRLTVTAGSDKERGRVAGRRVAVVVIVVELFYVQKPFNEKGEYVGLLTSVAAQQSKNQRGSYKVVVSQATLVRSKICLLL